MKSTTQSSITQCSIKESLFGTTPDGREITLYTLQNQSGMQVKIINFGAIITEIVVADRAGAFTDVVLGFDNLQQYVDKNPRFGAAIGRYANRIAGAAFTLDGREYKLFANKPPHTLHGGQVGFDKRVWESQSGEDGAGEGEHGSGEPGGGTAPRQWVKLRYVSPDGEEGFPGTLDCQIMYTLTADNALRIEYTATTDKATPFNITNHSYFNLAGAGSGDVLSHRLRMQASQYTLVDETYIPTGEIASVQGTPLDFTEETSIGSRINDVPGGYDHNLVVDAEFRGRDKESMWLKDPNSGRAMSVCTTAPGVQLYTSNNMGITKGVGGTYEPHGAVCLETQLFPDSVHHDNFPNCILRPGETFRSSTTYRFFVSD